MSRGTNGDGVEWEVWESWEVWRDVEGAWSLLFSRCESELGHAFAEAPMREEIFFEARELAVYQVVGLVNQADGDVCNDFGWAGFEEVAVGFVGLRGFATELSHVLGFFGVFGPLWKVAGA